jgi:hypothetical protein
MDAQSVDIESHAGESITRGLDDQGVVIAKGIGSLVVVCGEMASSESNNVLSIQKVAKLLNVPVGMIYAWKRRGRVPCDRPAKCVHIGGGRRSAALTQLDVRQDRVPAATTAGVL